MTIDIDGLIDAQEHHLTVGVIPKGGSPVRWRKEIDEFIKDVDVTNLYLLALIDLQRPGRWEDKFSYFQMAGIHGKPFAPWDGVTPEQGAPRREDLELNEERQPAFQPNKFAGYCSHSSNLFPTWHRAYLAMVEQSIFLQMVSIARAFPEKYQKRYMDAAQRFGLPYWDPFLPRRKVVNKYGYPIYKCGIPIILMIMQVSVKTPHQPDVPQEVDNPLYAYEFPRENENWIREANYSWRDMFQDVIQNPNMVVGTIRGPSPSGTTNHQYVNNTLTNAVSNLTGSAVPLGSKIYRILNGPTMRYTQMANSAFVDQDPKDGALNRENSLEGFHNDVHTMCGNGGDRRSGHMGTTEFAAFDPIFWMHHTNIDRIFAIWQELNPDAWDWEQRLLEGASFITPLGTEETPKSGLVPFRKEYNLDQSPRWWTSDEVRDCNWLGYTYPELVNAGGDAAKLRQWVIDTFEWTTIAGTQPPWKTLFEKVDLEKVESLPPVLRIDGRGPPIQESEEETRPSLANSISKSISSWFRPKSDNLAYDPSPQGRYKHLGNLNQGGKLVHWNVTIKVKKFALGGSFQIFVFLGDFNDEPQAWPHEPHLVGIDGIFAPKNTDNCENCRHQRERDLYDSDVIALTTPLIACWRSKDPQHFSGMRLDSLNPPDVLRFLRYNLHWRVLDSQGCQQRRVESLTVVVGSQDVYLPVQYGTQPRYETEVTYDDLFSRQ